MSKTNPNTLYVILDKNKLNNRFFEKDINIFTLNSRKYFYILKDTNGIYLPSRVSRVRIPYRDPLIYFWYLASNKKAEQIANFLTMKVLLTNTILLSL